MINTFNNTGDFRGAVLFQGSTITNTGTIAGTIPTADAASKEKLQSLIQQLGEALTAVPQDKMDDANAAASSVEILVTEAAKPSPNKSLLRTLGKGLLTGVKAVGVAAPTAISIAQGIVELISKIHGLG